MKNTTQQIHQQYDRQAIRMTDVFGVSPQKLIDLAPDQHALFIEGELVVTAKSHWLKAIPWLRRVSDFGRLEISLNLEPSSKKYCAITDLDLFP